MTPELLLVMSMLREGEGLRLAPYADSRGYLTVGYGHKLLPGDSRDPITKAYAEDLLTADSAKAWRDAGTISTATPARVVLTLMCYQLGYAGTLKHVKTIKLLKSEEYGKACFEMHNSQWYKQTPKRVQIISHYLEGIK